MMATNVRTPSAGKLIQRTPGRGHGPEAALYFEALKLQAPEGELGVVVVFKDLASAPAGVVGPPDAPLTVMLDGLGHRVLRAVEHPCDGSAPCPGMGRSERLARKWPEACSGQTEHGHLP